MCVWRCKCKVFNPKHTVPTVKHGGGSTIPWNCFAGTGGVDKLDVIMKEKCIKTQGISQLIKNWTNMTPKHTLKLFVARIKQAYFILLELNTIEHL